MAGPPLATTPGSVDRVPMRAACLRPKQTDLIPGKGQFASVSTIRRWCRPRLRRRWGPWPVSRQSPSFARIFVKPRRILATVPLRGKSPPTPRRRQSTRAVDRHRFRRPLQCRPPLSARYYRQGQDRRHRYVGELHPRRCFRLPRCHSPVSTGWRRRLVQDFLDGGAARVVCPCPTP